MRIANGAVWTAGVFRGTAPGESIIGGLPRETVNVGVGQPDHALMASRQNPESPRITMRVFDQRLRIWLTMRSSSMLPAAPSRSDGPSRAHSRCSPQKMHGGR
jgi:hypothetical protein